MVNNMACLRKFLIFTILSCFAYSKLNLLADTQSFCPKVTCSNDSKKEFCLKTINDPREERAELFFNICPKNKSCPISDFDPDQLSKELECEYDKKEGIVRHYTTRYAGEKCDALSTCEPAPIYDEKNFKFIEVSICEKDSKKCLGTPEDGRCKNNYSCNAGLFCKEHEFIIDYKICSKQKGINESCKDTYECRNDAICLNGKCEKIKSKKLGEEVGEKYYNRLLCEDLAQIEGKCAKVVYDSKYHSEVEDGYVKCDFNSKCNYLMFSKEDKSDAVSISSECICSLNPEGQGYCPLAKANDFNNWKISSLLKNHRHTESRYEWNFDGDSRCNNYNPALFKGADECMKEALGFKGCSSNLAKLGLILLISLFFLLL